MQFLCATLNRYFCASRPQRLSPPPLLHITTLTTGISWVICKSAPRSRQITTPALHYSSFLQAGCPSCRPTNSVKALKAWITHLTQICIHQVDMLNTLQITSRCQTGSVPYSPPHPGKKMEEKTFIKIINDLDYEFIQSVNQLAAEHCSLSAYICYCSAGTKYSYAPAHFSIGRKLADQSGDDREISFLFQRLSVLIQRYNAILLYDCFVNEEEE